VLDKIRPLVSGGVPPVPDKEKTTKLFAELSTLLKSNRLAEKEHIDALRQLPETAVLVRQIEYYDFKNALVTLEVLTQIWDL